MDISDQFNIQGVTPIKLIEQYGSPLYVYDAEIIKRQCQILIDAVQKNFGNNVKLLYACKANSNINILKFIKQCGIQGIDAVSPYEVLSSLQSGYLPNDIMYTGNYMATDEIEFVLKNNVLLNIGEVQTLQELSKEQYNRPRIAIRLNLDIGSGHHSHVVTGGKDSKFGIHFEQWKEQIIKAKQSVQIVGLHQHIGSKIMEGDYENYLKSVEKLFSVAKQLDLQHLEFINIGGGLGVKYNPNDISEQPIDLDRLFFSIASLYQKYFTDDKKPQIQIEPGRFIIAESGYLLSKVTAISTNPENHFVGTDSGMNHLIRPSLYGSYHNILNTKRICQRQQLSKYTYQICGNICESGDILGQNRQFDQEIQKDDILAILNVGAYGFSMSSNYNTRPRPAEIFIINKVPIQIRRRETYQDLLETTIYNAI